MIFIGAIFILFGILVIVMPQILAYIIAFFFISVGMQILVVGFYIQKSKKGSACDSEKVFAFGKYEFIRKK